jgi:hypothetical protein
MDSIPVQIRKWEWIEKYYYRISKMGAVGKVY